MAAMGEMHRILLVGSSGGHLAQLMQLQPWWGRHERAWVTFDTSDATTLLEAEADVTWAFRPTTRNVRNLLRNSWQSVKVLRRFRPTVVVSTGAAVAFPYFVLGRLTGVRTIYIEVFDRIETATLTGRLVRPFTDHMFVQWPEQLSLYDDALQLAPLL
jgi:UDP-N-acetylglucosamine:LPS N-acetylglucosamine transferase